MKQARTSKKSSRKRQASVMSQVAGTSNASEHIKKKKDSGGSKKNSSNAVSFSTSSSSPASATPSESSLPDGTRFPVYATLAVLLNQCFNPSTTKEDPSSPVFTTISIRIQWCNQATNILKDQSTSNVKERQRVFSTLSSMFEYETSEKGSDVDTEQENSEISIEDVTELIDEAELSWTKLNNACKQLKLQ